MKLGGLANKTLHVAVAAQAEVHCRDIFLKMFYIGRIACLRFPESQCHASRGTTPWQVISNYLHFIQD